MFLLLSYLLTLKNTKTFALVRSGDDRIKLGSEIKVLTKIKENIDHKRIKFLLEAISVWIILRETFLSAQILNQGWHIDLEFWSPKDRVHFTLLWFDQRRIWALDESPNIFSV